MAAAEQTLLDATDIGRRVLQNAVVLEGILFLIVAGVLFRRTEGFSLAGGILLVAGLTSILMGFFIRIRWDVSYKGHAIRFENDPFRGERLFIDDQLVARGGLGRRMVLQDSIKQGPGTGDRITAASEAGLFRFTCRITAQPA